VVGTLIVTSDRGVGRNDLHMRVAATADPTRDTRVGRCADRVSRRAGRLPTAVTPPADPVRVPM